MTPTQATLKSLHQFLASCPPGLRGVRLFRQSTIDDLVATDVAADDIDTRLADCIGQGLSVDWLLRNQVLYLRATEADGRAPSWERILAGEDMADVRRILGTAGE
jgi:hypothetical protein